MRPTILLLAVVITTSWASSLAIGQPNQQFEDFLDQLGQKDAAEYERIMGEWDKEREVEGPFWRGGDGREVYMVPLKGPPEGHYIAVDTGRVDPNSHYSRRLEAQRRVSPLIIILGLLLVAGGFLNLRAPGFLWELRQVAAEVEGVQATRSPAWDAFRRFRGWGLLAIGGIAVLAGVILAYR